VLVGLPVVFAVTRFASTLLFGLTPTDPVALSLAGLLMLAVAMAASYLPAPRNESGSTESAALRIGVSRCTVYRKTFATESEAF